MSGVTETSPDWLDLGSDSRISAGTKLPGEITRAPAVTKRASGKSRSWVCDGEYVWFRRKKANPAIKERLTDQLARGELKHVTTSDDVEIYKVLAKSPFHRSARDLTTLDMQTVTRETVLAVCKRDFATFLDGLEEIANRVKNARYTDGKPADANFARELYSDRVNHVFNMIRLRGGPSQAEIDKEVQALRSRRKDGSRSAILLPPALA